MYDTEGSETGRNSRPPPGAEDMAESGSYGEEGAAMTRKLSPAICPRLRHRLQTHSKCHLPVRAPIVTQEQGDVQLILLNGIHRVDASGNVEVGYFRIDCRLLSIIVE